MPFFAQFQNNLFRFLLPACATLVALASFALAYLLVEGTILKIATVASALVVLFVLIAAERKNQAGVTAWAHALRPAALLAVVFVLASSGAAITTFLRVPPTLTGGALLIPFALLSLADTHFGHGMRTRPIQDALLIALLAVMIIITLLALPLTFSAVGAITTVVVGALREVASHLDRGVLTTRFGLGVLGAVGGIMAVLIGSSKWS